MIEYPQIVSIPETYIRKKINEFLQEDAPEGDKTSLSIFKPNERTSAIIQAQEDLIASGLEFIKYFFDEKTKVEIFFKDGDLVPNNSLMAKISGFSVDILSKERVILNLLQRLSGIATLTSKYVKIAQPFNVKVLDTRKTTPGLRLFEKYAVKCGGGFNHRLDLSSGILIKDNHISAAGSINKAIRKAYDACFPMKIEVEVDNLQQILEALETGVDGFLLDNMSPDMIRKAVNMIRAYPGGNDIFIEASGGINLDNLHSYVDTGINAISSGSLTHSAKSTNIHMEIIL
ncbi:MAG: carboxylating nicotinate-nucleotide diphosphorylase [Candidatus Kapabacteria bacterium]|nr:carboxylating nicotinate-nucleotide diphosphorylase [Candidatus Kapabacteria bacterium]